MAIGGKNGNRQTPARNIQPHRLAKVGIVPKGLQLRSGNSRHMAELLELAELVRTRTGGELVAERKNTGKSPELAKIR